ncbi:MAG: hypothetical protein ACYC9R_12890 [Nitrosotalea sp.]
MTYASLTQVKEELNIASAITTNDTELNDLLTTIDNYINTRLQRFTSLPLQAEMQTYLADLESRWVVSRFRLRRATPQEQQQYQALITDIETQFQEYLKNNFQTSFFVQGSRSNEEQVLDLGERDQLDR